ncbi:hypothetical protein AVEN_160941-1 [Araneus ventricosus]|uniref:Uncharacterized protein n=1 Tax=Araneus ventricosus TaxID=182803 RepID=A0A4Y2JTX4_ARAVE|nr:hypothetical protein AVEN_160941-1 [Araneus ventricosus]
MVPSSCTTIPILLAKLKNGCASSSGEYKHPRFGTQPGFQTHSFIQYPEESLNLKVFRLTLREENTRGSLSGTRFSSESDVKTAAENWFNGQGRDFYQDGLNKLVLRSDKCLNRFGEYVEK